MKLNGNEAKAILKCKVQDQLFLNVKLKFKENLFDFIHEISSHS